MFRSRPYPILLSCFRAERRDVLMEPVVFHRTVGVAEPTFRQPPVRWPAVHAPRIAWSTSPGHRPSSASDPPRCPGIPGCARREPSAFQRASHNGSGLPRRHRTTRGPGIRASDGCRIRHSTKQCSVSAASSAHSDPPAARYVRPVPVLSQEAARDRLQIGVRSSEHRRWDRFFLNVVGCGYLQPSFPRHATPPKDQHPSRPVLGRSSQPRRSP